MDACGSLCVEPSVRTRFVTSVCVCLFVWCWSEQAVLWRCWRLMLEKSSCRFVLKVGEWWILALRLVCEDHTRELVENVCD